LLWIAAVAAVLCSDWIRKELVVMSGEGAGGDVDSGVRRMFSGSVGVDLSVSRRRTAVVSVEWGDRCASVSEPRVGVGDEELLGLVAGAEWVGISAPFGWPTAMVSAVHSYGVSGMWPEVDKVSFRYRRTDLFVRERLLEETGRKVWPLSVSSDGIALRAARLARLREEVGATRGRKFDRGGADGVVEVFPGSALLLWGFERGVYRRSDGSRGDEELMAGREEFVSSLEAEAPWLKWVGGSREVCLGNEDAMDALICAFVARAAGLGLTRRPGVEVEDEAKREGWVHLPEKDGLRSLVSGEVEVGSVV